MGKDEKQTENPIRNVFPWAYEEVDKKNKTKDSKTKRDEEMYSLTKSDKEKLSDAPVKPPVKEPVSFKEILIRLPVDDYDYLVEQKRETGVAPATNATKFVREKIRELRK
jgi:hypothetical protein